jgi:hypothetical protein
VAGAQAAYDQIQRVRKLLAKALQALGPFPHDIQVRAYDPEQDGEHEGEDHVDYGQKL